MFTLLTLMMVMLSSKSLFAQDVLRYDGEWPSGKGVLYSSRDGLILGTFRNGKPEGKCVCYRPNGEVYWGDYKKGKATGNGHLYRDNGIVFTGQFKNGRYHGLDTLYRNDGTVFVGKFKNGRLKSRLVDTKATMANMPPKPMYPRVDFKEKHESFLRDMELWQEARNLHLRTAAGFINPKFHGGNVEDFALWVNSQVEYPQSFENSTQSRTVLVEFTVTETGSVRDIHAVFGSNPELNQAAEKAVARSPQWEPGEFNGHKRSVRLTVPVVFTVE